MLPRTFVANSFGCYSVPVPCVVDFGDVSNRSYPNVPLYDMVGYVPLGINDCPAYHFGNAANSNIILLKKIPPKKINITKANLPT